MPPLDALPDLVADYVAGRIPYVMFCSRLRELVAQQDDANAFLAQEVRDRVNRARRKLRSL